MESQAEILARAVRDTLDSIVSPAVRDTLLVEALTLADEPDVPGELPRFLEFLDGALRRTLERAFGNELGRSVVAELERLTEGLAQEPLPQPPGARRTRPAKPRAPGARPPRTEPLRPQRSISPRARQASTLPPPPAAPAPSAHDSPLPPRPLERREANTPTAPALPRLSQPRPPTSRDYPAGTASAFGLISSAPPAQGRRDVARRLPVVFVATRDVELVRRFGAWLDPRAAVVRVSRLTDLLLDVQDAGDRKTVVVLDGHQPPIRPEALAALAEELPENVRVVLWGGAPDVAQRLSDVFPRVAQWLVCATDTPLADLVDRCAEIVG